MANSRQFNLVPEPNRITGIFTWRERSVCRNHEHIRFCNGTSDALSTLSSFCQLLTFIQKRKRSFVFSYQMISLLLTVRFSHSRSVSGSVPGCAFRVLSHICQCCFRFSSDSHPQYHPHAKILFDVSLYEFFYSHLRLECHNHATYGRQKSALSF